MSCIDERVRLTDHERGQNGCRPEGEVPEFPPRDPYLHESFDITCDYSTLAERVANNLSQECLRNEPENRYRSQRACIDNTFDAVE